MDPWHSRDGQTVEIPGVWGQSPQNLICDNPTQVGNFSHHRLSVYTTGSDETCLCLGLEIIKISDCMTILEIFPCYFGKHMPSASISSH